MPLDIRRITALADIAPVVELQAAVWGREEAVPSHQLLITARYGGLLLGAYEAGELVGFAYAFPAWTPRDGAWLHSQMLAVREDLRSRGVGWQLKVAQRAEALAMGYRRITWTYDPLQGPNAHLNIARLGAIARHYEVDVYGGMTDALNAGLPSDRFLVEWELDSPRVRERLAGQAPPAAEAAPLVNPVAFRDGRPYVAALDLGRQEPELAVAIPERLADLKAADPGLALDWRLQTRAAFQHYFAAGYAVVDLRRGTGVHHYLLRRGGDPFAR
jgi:predicted GNAT superfamily acetyltransferase